MSAPVARRARSLPAEVWRRPEGRLGIVLGGLVALLVIGGALLAPATQPGDAAPALGPSAAHLLGTDALGRDVLARLAAGGTSVVIIPFLATTLALIVGGGLGLVGGVSGGTVDVVATKVFDAMLTLPPILIVLFVISAFGSSSTVLVVTVAAVYAPQFGRVVRASAQLVSVQLYVAAARARGERLGSILLREVLPNTSAPLIATYALNFTYAVLFVAGLSFLGLGVQPPTPDWGLMISENRSLISIAPLATLAPAAAVTALAVAVNLVGDAVSEVVTGISPDRLVSL